MTRERFPPADRAEMKLMLLAALDAQGEPPADFDVDQWIEEWLHRSQPALGGVRPIDLAATPAGLDSVRRVFGAITSGAFQ